MNDLIIKENLVPSQIFTEAGIDPLLKSIKEEVDKFVPDMTSEKGRAEIKSMARKVSRSKTYLEEKALELTEEWAKKKKVVDVSRAKFKKELDALRDEVRRPVTEWENAEKDRVTKYAQLLENLKNRDFLLHSTDFLSNIDMLKKRADALDILIVEDDAREFKVAVIEAINNRKIFIRDELSKQEKLQEEKIELDQLREEKRLRDIEENEQRIRNEEKEKAENEAKEKARLEADKVKREREEASAREAKLEQDKIDAEKRALELAEKAKQDKIDAEIKAKQDIKDAQIAERKKIEAKRLLEDELETKRQADVKHRNKIISEIEDDIDSEWDHTEIVRAMVNRNIRHVKVVF